MHPQDTQCPLRVQPDATDCALRVYGRPAMTELARRYRAARAYAGLTQAQLAKRLEVDKTTVKRRERGGGDPKLSEQLAVAHFCGVPETFMTHGWAAVPVHHIPRDKALQRELKEAGLPSSNGSDGHPKRCRP